MKFLGKKAFLYQILLLIQITFGYKTDFKYPKYNNALTDGIKDIVNQFFSKKTHTISILHASENNDTINDDAINEVLYHFPKTLTYRCEDYLHYHKIQRRRINNIFIVDTYVSFLNILNLMDPYHFKFDGHYLIVMTTYSEDQYEIMSKMFNDLWKNYIVNSQIYWHTPDNVDEAVLYTYFPYNRFSCGRTFPIQQNHFRFGSWIHNNSDFFPNKMSNLFGCPLKVAIIPTPPFIIMEEQANGSMTIGGIDGVLLKLLSEKINFKIDAEIFTSQGTIIQSNNQTKATGAFQMILENKANLTIGYIASSVLRNYYMSASYTYYTSNLIWMCPPGRLFTSLEKLIMPFTVLLWLSVWIVFVLSVITISLIRCRARVIQSFVFGVKNTSPYLNLTNVLLGGSIRLPRRNFARTLLAFYLFYCLIIRSSYTGALFNFLRMESREDVPKDMSEMIRRDFKFYVLDSSAEFVSSMPVIANRTQSLTRSELRAISLKLLNSQFKGALLSSEDHVAYNNRRVYPDEFYHYSNEAFSTFNLCIYMNRKSCLVKQIDSFIIKLRSNGLIKMWSKQYVDRSYLVYHPPNEPKPMGISTVLGAFQILLCGIVMSTLIFIAESFAQKHNVLRAFFNRIR